MGCDEGSMPALVLFMMILSSWNIDSANASANNNDLQSAIDTFVTSGFECHPNIPALSVAVVHQDNTVISKGYGFQTMETKKRRKEKVTNETLFGIGSLSKAFAATLILKLIDENDKTMTNNARRAFEQGAFGAVALKIPDYTRQGATHFCRKLSVSISLSTKIKDILNNDGIFSDSLRSKYTTLEDLLAHRLGIRSNSNIRLDSSLTRKDLVRRLKHLKPSGGFRTSFFYNNLMYGLLTYISEVIGQKSWEVLVKEKIFDALSMTSSTFITTADTKTLDMAQGYTETGGTLYPVPVEFSRHWGELCGADGVLSSANDMLQWMKFHLSGGTNSRGETILRSYEMAQMYEQQNSLHTGYMKTFYTRPITPVTWTLDNYGLGWKMGYYRGYKVISHSGSTYGYRAMLTLVPDLQIGVFVVLSGDDHNYMLRTNIHSYIIDVISGNQPWLNSTSVCTFPNPWRNNIIKNTFRPIKNISPKRTLKWYTGKYENEAYGTCEFYLNTTTGLLMAQIGIGQFVMYPKRERDGFVAVGFGLIANLKDFANFQFKFKNQEGYASELVVPSFNYRQPPEFKRVGNTTA